VSAAGGVPVAKDIFRATMRQLHSTKKSSADEVDKVLRYLYPGFDRKLKYYPKDRRFPKFLGDGKKV